MRVRAGIAGVDEDFFRDRPDGLYLTLTITLNNETWAGNARSLQSEIC